MRPNGRDTQRHGRANAQSILGGLHHQHFRIRFALRTAHSGELRAASLCSSASALLGISVPIHLHPAVPHMIVVAIFKIHKVACCARCVLLVVAICLKP
jgi:hypothetical protein